MEGISAPWGGEDVKRAGLSSGYRDDWQVQFPKGIRERGSRHVVTGVREAIRGGFYRPYGDIRRLI